MKERRSSHVLASDLCCNVCSDGGLEVVPGHEMFHLVTSDCKPWHKASRLCVCQACGCVQKAIDPAWQFDAKKIYEAYSIYHQSGGTEQSVFEEISGRASSRSARLLDRLRSRVQIPETGRLLDIGCGNGALLQAFARFARRWSLVGTELDDKCRPVVESIDGVETLYTCQPHKIPGRFNFIMMIHVLEHILAPRDFIAKLREKFEFGGLLVLQMPDYQQNPFDLLVADHCTHFTVATITAVIEKAGFEIVSVATDWIPKELTIVARKSRNRHMNRVGRMASQTLESTTKCLEWLESVAATAREIGSKGGFGLFGTSIAATWLFGELEGLVNFFVDEDPRRVGKTYMGLPVYHPRQVRSNSHVFIALPTRLAESIQTRMETSRFRFSCYTPPPFLW